MTISEMLRNNVPASRRVAESNRRQRRGELLALGHGMFNVAGGVWPLVHMPSFEKVLGPKEDRWLVRTVAGLLLAIGATQMTAKGPGGAEAARRLGIGTAGTLMAIDLVYAPPRRISRVYLLDAAAQSCWLGLWARTRT